jgi:serine/threonine protein phosphatase PrpC
MAILKTHASTDSGQMALRPSDEELDLFGITHQGKVRAQNQDHFMVCTVHPQVVVHDSSLPDTAHLPLRGTRLATFLLVADGVGGGAAGDEAARLAAETVTRYVSSTLRSYHATGSAGDEQLHDALKSAAFEAHDAVRAEAATRTDQRTMATTLTVALFVWPWLYVVQVGDSRCYVYMDGKLNQITRDQTVGQHLVDQGLLPRERLRHSPLGNTLASAIGADEAAPVVTHTKMNRSCVALLCSDGLTKHVSDEEIAAHIRDMTSSEQLCRALLDLTLSRGATDNVTIVVGRAPQRKSLS